MYFNRRFLVKGARQVLKFSRRNDHTIAKSSEPLSIAYFGTDKFSVFSLQRLNRYKEENPDKIKSIDVITRSIKPTGRHLKQTVDMPIGNYSKENGINIIRADTEDGIMNILTEKKFDLSVAVSYGKLIPANFISSCKYGGLNVHPSLLPKYSGSSPLQYSLIHDDAMTGVTVQTLHPTKFDRGELLLQSHEVPIEENENYSSLEDKLGKIGSDLLIEVIDKRLFVDSSPIKPRYDYSLASKISPKHREIIWGSMTSRSIKRLNDALGPLYTYKYVDIVKKKKQIKEFQKVILADIKPISKESNFPIENFGEFFYDAAFSSIIVKTIDGYVSIGELKFQYCGEESPEVFMNHLRKRSGETGLIFSQRS